MFKKAERKQAKLKIGLSGTSGSGKTYSALLLAKGIGGKIAVIDTENGSASLYADRFEFDSCSIEAPFTTEKYINAMKEAEKSYDVVIIDSASHQWNGDGGILSRKEQIDARGGNSFTNWSKFSPEHNKFLAALVQHDTHLICTVRSKTDYSTGQNEKGKMAPQKIGLAPVQRDGFEYEFAVMFDLASDHSAQASKDRTSLFDKTIITPSEETGKILMNWLLSGKKVWKFEGNEKDHLRALMNSFVNGRQIFNEWEKRFGPISTIDETWYTGLCAELEEEKLKVASDPQSFDNFVAAPQ